MDLMRHSLPNAAQYLEEVGYARWARSHFSRLRYSAMTSNSVESVNSVTQFARYLPITISNDECSDSLGAKIEKRIHRSANWKVYPISDLLFEVDDRYKKGTCDLHDKTCTCMQWQLSGIACAHVIFVVRSLDIQDCSQFCFVWFNSDSYHATYEEEVIPLPPEAEYVLPNERMTVLPPPLDIQNSGRPRNRDCIPSRDEKPIVTTCSRCHQSGHLRYNCPSPMPAPRLAYGSSSNRQRSVSRPIDCGSSQPDTTQDYVFDTYDLSK
ncbi:uncharacterized protein LOC112510786 [Cynara cardunculus var. scolymus]|uniref:uncharacterized protein LOC112510786 n=1 Tax=Cynara cardunculus var. scolymus TaxID=59895 RepID=UPI000D62F94D|nr:uncharacterized protein LOC112510786 [Cynara cardunculus var. scolymus]